MKNMTAKVSCFARAYHYKNNIRWVFCDEIADKILSKDEYDAISDNMSKGIQYFNPGFIGTDSEALRYIVDKQLSPSVLARSKFCERSLDNAVMRGCKQYIIFASGYDTYSLRTAYADLKLYELDLPDMIDDKRNRIENNCLEEKCKTMYIACDIAQSAWKNSLINSGFNLEKTSFGSMLGISYYLKKEEFACLLQNISDLWSEGSSICFDYPIYEEGIESVKNQEMARAANEQMQSKYSYEEVEKILEKNGFLIYEHYNSIEASAEFFDEYNRINSQHQIIAPKGVCYCLAVKKSIQKK